MIKNYEPDCNSAFGLYNKKNEGEYEYYIESANYEYDDALMSAVAKNQCDTAKWDINIAKDAKIEPQVITAFCFTSILAMNVRFIGKFNW